MRVEFGNRDLARLVTDSTYFMGLSGPLVKAYRRRINQIKAAVSEQDFRMWLGMHFERLKGDRQHQYSMRLNAQFRLIVELCGESPNKVVRVVGVEDYH